MLDIFTPGSLVQTKGGFSGSGRIMNARSSWRQSHLGWALIKQTVNAADWKFYATELTFLIVRFVIHYDIPSTVDGYVKLFQ